MILCLVIYAMLMAEQSGHGIPTIVRKYGKEAFDFRGSTIKVTIKYAFDLINIKEDVVENVPVNVPVNDTVKMSNTEKKVYDEIVDNNDITREMIANNIRMNIKTVARALNTLKDKGIIKRVGSDKTGRWEVIN